MTVRASPIRYAGGKSRALTKLESYFPAQVDEYREPFIGGGSVALHVGSKYPHVRIWVNDLYRPVACFWQTLQRPTDLIDGLLDLHGRTKSELKARREFQKAVETLKDDTADDLALAIAFYFYNRLSFAGASRSGFTLSGYERWHDAAPRIGDLASWSAKIAHWRITSLDYEAVMAEPWTGKAPFLYCDPPYQLAHEDALYGNDGDTHRGFDQIRFQATAENSDVLTLVTLNAELVRQFSDWPVNKIWDHYYSIGRYRTSRARSNELVLANYSRAGQKYEQVAQARGSDMPAHELLDALKTLELSQTAAARLLGVSLRAFQYWVAGERKMPGPAILLMRQMVRKRLKAV